MGWSCRTDASKTEKAWEVGCRNQTGTSNTFEDNGNRYFYETSRRDQADGGICGTIWKYVGNDMAKRAGSFRINGDGTIERAPKKLKEFANSGKS